MSIKDKIIDSFKNEEIGKIFKRQEIIDKVLELYEVNESSIIPSDLCYNRVNENIDIIKSNKLFEYINVSSYKYLGPNYKYTGDVYTKKKNSDEEVKVGSWNNGEYKAIIDLKAEEALWVAAAKMAYEIYNSKIDISVMDFYFKQSEVLKEANKLRISDIEGARISYHTDANNKKSSHKYFIKREIDSFVRLVYNGEMNGEKEKPRSIDKNIEIKTIVGIVTVGKLMEFIDNEYTNIIAKKLKINLEKKYYLDILELEVMENNNCMSKNQILYGPPGTGKTYNAIYRALEIINRDKYKDIIEDSNKREEAVSIFNQLLEDGQIAFCTFHQSYGYEEFIEGLRSSASGLGFEPKDGVFKRICERAIGNKKARIAKYDFDVNKIEFYKMSLGEKNVDDDIYKYCINNSYIATGWGGDIDYKDCNTLEEIKNLYFSNTPEAKGTDFDIEALKRFKLWMKKGDLVIISDGNKKAKAIGKIIGDYIYNDNSEIPYKHFRKVEWLYAGDSIDVSKILLSKNFSQQSIYQFYKDDLNLEGIRNLVDNTEALESGSSSSNNYVLIIDEINRGNISKIFGELITLIEDDKRIGAPNELRATLPYSGNKFGVPSNLYILGTMNTADRSIALLDTALRRRFEFFEYMPNEELLPSDIDGINVKEFLSIINKRIEYLFDREHTIGHAYFIKDNLDFDGLVSIMKNKVIPLLQEYFYGDYDKISLVLGGYTNVGKSNRFIVRENINAKELFRNKNLEEDIEQYKYSIVEKPNKEAFWNIYSEVESIKED